LNKKIIKNTDFLKDKRLFHFIKKHRSIHARNLEYHDNLEKAIFYPHEHNTIDMDVRVCMS